MLIKPKITDLLKKVDSVYTLVALTSKRARKITEKNKQEELDADTLENPITEAAQEVIDDKITYVRTKSGIK